MVTRAIIHKIYLLPWSVRARIFLELKLLEPGFKLSDSEMVKQALLKARDTNQLEELDKLVDIETQSRE